MGLFINLGIVGLGLIILGKSNLKGDNQTNKTTDLRILDKLLCYMESDMLGNINLKYGKLLLITGITGALFYNTLGLLMVIVMVLVLSLYLVSLFMSVYKFYINIR